MNKIWIKEYGNTPESEIQGVINRYMPADSLGIAYYTDRFRSADKKHLAALCEDIPHLLELRLFNDMGELLAEHSSGDWQMIIHWKKLLRWKQISS